MNLSGVFTTLALILVIILAATCATAEKTATPSYDSPVENGNAVGRTHLLLFIPSCFLVSSPQSLLHEHKHRHVRRVLWLL